MKNKMIRLMSIINLILFLFIPVNGQNYNNQLLTSEKTDEVFYCGYFGNIFIDLRNLDPISYIEILTVDPECSVMIKGKSPKNWIKKEHIPFLINLIYSKQPASVVIYPRTSNIPIGEISTVGNEAMILIDGYKNGYYPRPAGSSAGFNGNPNDYMRWWNEYSEVEQENSN